MKKWKLGFEVLIICFLAVIWCALYLEKQNEQEDQYPDNSESSENDGEDRLIIVSTDDKSKEQEDEFLFPADSVKKIVLELSCEDHMTQENNEDVPALEAADFSITDSVNVIRLDQPFDSSVTDEQEWTSSYTGEIYIGDLEYKLYCHEYEDFELYTSNYQFDIKDRTFDEYFIWQITIKTSKYKTARGITTGDCMEDVEKAYGTGEKELISNVDICESYDLDGMTIRFEMDECGTVTAIKMYKTGNYEKTPYFFGEFFGRDQKQIAYNALLHSSDFEEMQQNLKLNINGVKVFEAGTLYRLYLSLPDAEVSWDGSSPEYLALGYYYVTDRTVYRIFGPDAEGDEKDMKEEAKQMVRDGSYEQCMIVCDENGIEDMVDENGRHGYIEDDGDRRIFHCYSDDENGRNECETIVWEKGTGIIYYQADMETVSKRENPAFAAQEEKTTEQDTWENAQQAYEEFVDGKRGACGMDMLELATPTGEPNRRYITKYVIIDSNGDGIPELHTRTGREFYSFTYRNGQMEILAGYFSNPTQYTLLTDGSFIYREDRGTTRGNYYRKFRLDAEGEEIDETEFWWMDINKNLVMDENDEYGFDNAECTKEEWLSRTAEYIYIHKFPLNR